MDGNHKLMDETDFSDNKKTGVVRTYDKNRKKDNTSMMSNDS